MVRYEAPVMEIAYFDDIISASQDAAASQQYTNAAYNMNQAAFDPNGIVNAAAARTVKVQTILDFKKQ